MTRRLVIRPEAEADITNAVVWYEDRELGLGDTVLKEIRAAIDRALVFPEAFTLCRESPEVHRVLVRQFPYRVFYILEFDALVVFAVLHAARHERHWLRRT